MSGPGTGGPARSYRWKDAEPGNELAVTHGARSERHLAPRAEAIVAEVLSDPNSAYLKEAAYAGILTEYGRVSAQCDLFWAWLVEHGTEAAMTDTATAVEDEETSGGKTRRKSASRRTEAVWTQYHRAATRKANLAAALGLTPLSRARLGRDIAGARFDLAQLFAEIQSTEER